MRVEMSLQRPCSASNKIKNVRIIHLFPKKHYQRIGKEEEKTLVS